MKRDSDTILVLRISGAEENDTRLILAGIIIIFPLALFLGHIFPQDLGFRALQKLRPAKSALQMAARIYPVLVQQKYAPKVRSKQIRALSDVTAQGTGRLTKKRGFHTASPHDTLEFPETSISPPASQDRQTQKKRVGEGFISGQKRKQPNRTGKSSQARDRVGENQFKIPFNYRFQQDIRLNFDGSGAISIPRQKFAEFHYFQRMLRKIRESYAPPWMNYVVQDAYGYSAQNTIKPQSVRVLFRIDQRGVVRSIRVLPPIVQKAVADSCVLALEGQNFGPPPAELLERGGIIGLNFIFPPMRMH